MRCLCIHGMCVCVCVCVFVFIVRICDVPSRLRGIEINSIRVAYMRARFCLTKDPTKAKRTFAPFPFKRVSVLYRRSCSKDHMFNALFCFLDYTSIPRQSIQWLYRNTHFLRIYNKYILYIYAGTCTHKRGLKHLPFFFLEIKCPFFWEFFFIFL